MSNGPMGGFMPTPAAPAQPPTVKLDTTALSRGNFNNFLKNMSGASSLNPPMAPQMGAMMSPSLAPSVSDIDIFNPPVQMMFNGGQVDDFGDFRSAGDDAPSVDDGSSFSDDAQSTDSGGESIVGDDPIADLDFNVITTPTVTEQERQQNIQDSEDFITGTTQFPSAQNFGSRLNLTSDRIADIKKNINLDNERIISEDDTLYENNQLTPAGQAELNKMNTETFNLVASGDIPASRFTTASSSADILGEKDVKDALNLSKSQQNIPSPQFDMFGNVIGSTPPNDPSAGLRNVADVLKGGESLTYDPLQNKISFSSADDKRSRSADMNIDQVPYETLNRGADTFGGIRAGLNFDKTLVDEGILPVGEFNVRSPASNQLPNIDVFENIIDRNFQNTGLAGANLPTIGSTRSTVAEDQARALSNLVGDRDQTIGEKLQQNILEERGRALGPTTFRDDAADVTFGNIRGQTPTTDTVFDIDTTDTRNFVGDDFQTALDLVDARQKALTARDANVRDMDDIDIATAGRASDFPTLSTTPEDFEENVGRRFDPDRMADIERLYNLNVGQTKAGKGTDPTFFESLGVPTPATAIGDFVERKSRENMANQIALGRPMGLGETLFGFNAPDLRTQTMKEYMANTQKNVLNEAGDSETVSRRLPENQLIRNDSGRVIGIRDASGRLVSGMDPNASVPPGDDGDASPIILPRTSKPEEKTPTNIGMMGGANPFLPSQSPVVVDSPFTTNVGDFKGTGFSTGDLNKLIAQLTGIKSPRSMAKGGVAKFANGGLIKAVDDFLSTGQ